MEPKLTGIEYPQIVTERTVSRLARRADASSILTFYRTNKEHFDPWNPERPDEFYTEFYWREIIQDSLDEFRTHRSLRLNIHLKENGELIGMANFTNFERGPFQNCRLGYRLGKKFEGQGLMNEALRASIQYVFDTLGFHRIEANFLPINRRSEALLRRLGFTFHGRAPSYLKIHGRWEDHILASLINPSALE